MQNDIDDKQYNKTATYTVSAIFTHNRNNPEIPQQASVPSLSSQFLEDRPVQASDMESLDLEVYCTNTL